MPTYEYYCEDCGKNFAVILSMAEHDKKETVCPDCKKNRIVQQYTAFFAKTSKKS